MPVAHSDEYGKRRTTPFQCQFQPTRLLECQFVDRRPPSNEFIMMGNLINPLLWNRTPARHIRKEWANIFSFFRPPKCNYEDCIKFISHSKNLQIRLGFINRRGRPPCLPS